VDAYDFELLAENWLENCSDPYWCDDSDFNQTHRVDMADFAQLATQWLTSGLPDPGE
jgi:hypothetical protein